jgi:LuxR family maltose regulon positive regulatory protein
VLRADLERAQALLPQVTYVLAFFAVSLRLEFARIHLALGDGDAARRLLREIDEICAHRPQLGVLTDDVGAFRADLERTDREMASLTAAELRLLPLLTTHLSFREIADRLFVSRNTVKTQAISVYRKLGVSSRGEAIDRASGLGLVATAPHADAP